MQLGTGSAIWIIGEVGQMQKSLLAWVGKGLAPPSPTK